MKTSVSRESAGKPGSGNTTNRRVDAVGVNVRGLDPSPCPIRGGVELPPARIKPGAVLDEVRTVAAELADGFDDDLEQYRRGLAEAIAASVQRPTTQSPRAEFLILTPGVTYRPMESVAPKRINRKLLIMLGAVALVAATLIAIAIGGAT